MTLFNEIPMEISITAESLAQAEQMLNERATTVIGVPFAVLHVSITEAEGGLSVFLFKIYASEAISQPIVNPVIDSPPVEASPVEQVYEGAELERRFPDPFIRQAYLDRHATGGNDA